MTVRFWGRGVLGPNCAHVRESRNGQPVAEEVDGDLLGFALCGCLLIADIDPEAEGVSPCSTCVELLDDSDGSA